MGKHSIVEFGLKSVLPRGFEKSKPQVYSMKITRLAVVQVYMLFAQVGRYGVSKLRSDYSANVNDTH